MELSEMEKRMLYQTDGTERYGIISELSMASRYANDPVRRKAAKSLVEKLCSLSDEKCIDLVRDIQKNYRLPKEGRTIGELIAEARRKSGAEKLKGHDIMALERFDPEVQHMIVFDVLSVDSPVGDKGDRMRLFLTEDGYRKFVDGQEKEQVKIRNHAKVTYGGYLHYDRKNQER